MNSLIPTPSISLPFRDQWAKLTTIPNSIWPLTYVIPERYLPNFPNICFEATPTQIWFSALIQSPDHQRFSHTHMVSRSEMGKIQAQLRSRQFLNLSVCVIWWFPGSKETVSPGSAFYPTTNRTQFTVLGTLIFSWLCPHQHPSNQTVSYIILLFKATSQQKEKLVDSLKPQTPLGQDPVFFPHHSVSSMEQHPGISGCLIKVWWMERQKTLPSSMFSNISKPGLGCENANRVYHFIILERLSITEPL